MNQQPDRPLTEDQKIERTDVELAAKLRGQLKGVTETMGELHRRGYTLEAKLYQSEYGVWCHLESITKELKL